MYVVWITTLIPFSIELKPTIWVTKLELKFKANMEGSKRCNLDPKVDRM